MDKAKVYFTDFRTVMDVSLTDKLKKLCRKAGFDSIDMDHKFVAIKMHFGELGNMAYLRPNYARAIVEMVKEKGGIPFLTDSNTLYPGSRKHAVEHLDCAMINGFSPMSTGTQVIIADGLRGLDEVEVPVPNGVYCKTALIGQAVVDADIIISLAHFKGHEATGFGGAIKNVGMGSASRAGKMQQHNDGKPLVDPDTCVNCKRCSKECGSDAIFYDTGKAVIHQDICVGCGRCIAACPFDAIYQQWDSANEMVGRKMAEYTQAIVHDKPSFFVNIVRDISPNCDCHAENDAPILPDVGMFASFDPVAIDTACADACLKLTPIRNSQLGDNLAKKGWKIKNDNFLDNNPSVRYKETLEHGEQIGLGTRDYELVTIQ